jgi:hypothetical protein
LIARQEVELQSGEAQSLLRHFYLANTALYRLGITLPKRTDIEQTAEIRQIVYAAISQLEETLQAEYARINLLHKDCVPDPKVSFSKPLKTCVDLAHPDSQRLLDLLAGFDRMQRQLSELWFAGQIQDRDYLKVGTHCRHTLKEGLKHLSRLVRTAQPQQEAGKQGKTLTKRGLIK